MTQLLGASRRPGNLSAVYDALLALAEPRDLTGLVLAYQGDLAKVEALAHELAHQLEAGRKFELRIRACIDDEADEHEAAALRIEVEALALLGVRVTLRNLWRLANWRSRPPTLTRERRALSDRERRCAVAFARIVGAAMHGAEPRGSGA